jgi:RimJ/RimL family protein N-acetyltransferase
MNKVSLIKLDMALLDRVITSPESAVVPYTIPSDLHPLVRDVASHTKSFLSEIGDTHEWGCFLAANVQRQIVGTCGFKGKPDDNAQVEIAYFTFPPFQGCGYATAMAAALIDRARDAKYVRAVIAHTLAEYNASTRVLQKVGMQFVGEHNDPEDGVVWRWSLRFKPDT